MLLQNEEADNEVMLVETTGKGEQTLSSSETVLDLPTVCKFVIAYLIYVGLVCHYLCIFFRTKKSHSSRSDFHLRAICSKPQ